MGPKAQNFESTCWIGKTRRHLPNTAASKWTVNQKSIPCMCLATLALLVTPLEDIADRSFQHTTQTMISTHQDHAAEIIEVLGGTHPVIRPTLMVSIDGLM